jgi:hypothetical protein
MALVSMLLLAVFAVSAQRVDVTGDWQVTISTRDGVITGKASLKQTGGTVSGWVGPSENDPIPVDGVLEGDKLTLTTSPQPGRTVAFAKCAVTVTRDKMSGTIDTNKGKIEFVRTTL